MVKAESIEALLYGCTRQDHDNKLRTAHYQILVLIFRAKSRKPDYRILSYNCALELTGCDSVGTTVRTKRLLKAWSITRMTTGCESGLCSGW